MNTKICKKQYDTPVANFKIYNLTDACPENYTVCGVGKIKHRDQYTRNYCVKDNEPCPITNIKLVKKDSLQGEELHDHLPRNNTDKMWYYIRFSDEYTLGVSTIDYKEPIVSIAVSEKQPCMNVQAVEILTDDHTQTNRLENAKYVTDKCSEGLDDRYETISAPRINTTSMLIHNNVYKVYQKQFY
jgi:hypothetical protein